MYEIIINTFNSIPIEVLVLGIIALPLLWILIGKGVKNNKKWNWTHINMFLSIVWLIIMVYCALISRKSLALEGMVWNWIPLISPFSTIGVRGCLLNIIMMEPLGMFISTLLPYWKSIALGAVVSLVIEILQPILALGSFETFDIIWNTVGCGIGALSGLLFDRIGTR